jgi:hypothetical protein
MTLVDSDHWFGNLAVRNLANEETHSLTQESNASLSMPREMSYTWEPGTASSSAFSALPPFR